MLSGAPIIVQAALRSGQWAGRADVLRRVERQSNLGGWSYEAVDAKLARETKGGTILQLSLYSDLLLHDIGTGDGILQAAANGEEIRTPALWGLRLRRPLLHDGSAATADEAVRRHAGEAELARRGYEQLPAADRAALMAFLRSL